MTNNKITVSINKARTDRANRERYSQLRQVVNTFGAFRLIDAGHGDFAVESTGDMRPLAMFTSGDSFTNRQHAKDYAKCLAVRFDKTV